eukprot:CAMPEP_0198109148 /NCGR_PEP_ID=MMETSP1442-20131203/1161_1 /TAXON_ID= /ORGANISM="Craspedostauros australis, Strain CCMP3328" /LENGTH=218 /DNA_ID=CAMNT_0043764669 /DNA_START=18 /DNA_END=674 /DNA_ORIENTATION=-
MTWKGRLAQLLTDGSSPNPRWLLKFDGQQHKDEEVYERSFGRLVYSTGDDASDASPTDVTKLLPPQKRARGRYSPSCSDAEGIDADHTFHAPPSGVDIAFDSAFAYDAGEISPAPTAASDEDSATMDFPSSRVSAREARSRRRQAKIDEDVIPTDHVHHHIPAKTHPKRRMPHSSGTGDRHKKQRTVDVDEPIKVKLLTGTLLLYRGAQRRVEFNRRV